MSRRERSCYTSVRGGVAFKFLVLLAVVFAFGAVAWMLLLPVVLTRQLTERTGFSAAVHRFVLNPFSGYVEIEGLVLENPGDFIERSFADVQRIEAQADLRTQFGGSPVFKDARVELARLTLVLPVGGPGNLERFAQRLRWTGGRRLDAPGEKPARAISVSRLAVKISRLEVIDLRTGSTTPRVWHDLDFTVPEVRVGALRGAAFPVDGGPVEAAIAGLVPAVITQTATEALNRVAGSVSPTPSSGPASSALFRALEETEKP